jgi:focal adhesion kinase 1
VELGEIIGEGQFGDVHKGTFKGRDNQLIPVAVKTCKADADLSTAEKFLEEACKYFLCCILACWLASHEK